MEPIRPKQDDIRVVPVDGLKWRVEYRKWECDHSPHLSSHPLEESEIDAKVAEFRQMCADRDKRQQELTQGMYTGVPAQAVPDVFKPEWRRANITAV